MSRRVLIALGMLLLPLGVGCSTREPVMWSWPHWKRKTVKFVDGFHEFHMDFDRIILDMEEYPLEPDYY